MLRTFVCFPYLKIQEPVSRDFLMPLNCAEQTRSYKGLSMWHWRQLLIRLISVMKTTDCMKTERHKTTPISLQLIYLEVNNIPNYKVFESVCFELSMSSLVNSTTVLCLTIGIWKISNVEKESNWKWKYAMYMLNTYTG